MTLLKKVYLTAAVFALLACWTDFVRGTGCENEGPCGPDNFCSKFRDICRPCQDIVGHCQNRTYILSQYLDCDAFCFQMKLEKTTSYLSEQTVAFDASKAELKRLNDTLIREKENCAKDIAAKNVDWPHYILFGLGAASVIANAVFIVILIRLCKKKNPDNGIPEAAELKNLLKTGFSRAQSTAPSEGYATGFNSIQATPPTAERYSHSCDKTTSMEHIHTEDTQCHCPEPSLALLGN